MSNDLSPSSTGLRILVVEDVADSRELMADLLRETGPHSIELAESGDEGLLHLRTTAYDLIVTDIGLPGMTGLEMLDHAKEEGRLDGATVAVCSGNHSLRPQVVAQGGHYIPKPIDTDALPKTIAEHLSRTATGA